MTNRIYTLPADKNIQELAHAVESYLTNSENMNCQLLKSEMGEYIVQGRAQNGKMCVIQGMLKPYKAVATKRICFCASHFSAASFLYAISCLLQKILK